jgi:DinB superfamily
MAIGKDNQQSLREHVLYLLKDGGAHAGFDAATKGLPVALRGKTPKGAEHSPWEILEHLRIAQHDILEFSRNPKHVSPDWPAGYWPKAPAPPNSTAWSKSVKACQADLNAMCDLVADPSTDLYARIPHGDGQTILREALLIADHNAYHLGQLILVRRLLGAWK